MKSLCASACACEDYLQSKVQESCLVWEKMETNGQQNSDRDMIPGVNNFKGVKITIIQ